MYSFLQRVLLLNHFVRVYMYASLYNDTCVYRHKCIITDQEKMRYHRVVIHQPHHPRAPQRTHPRTHASNKPTAQPPSTVRINAALHALQLFSIAAAATCTIVHTRTNPTTTQPARTAQLAIAAQPPMLPPSTSTWFLLLALAASSWLTHRLHTAIHQTWGCVSTACLV